MRGVSQETLRDTWAFAAPQTLVFLCFSPFAVWYPPTCRGAVACLQAAQPGLTTKLRDRGNGQSLWFQQVSAGPLMWGPKLAVCEWWGWVVVCPAGCDHKASGATLAMGEDSGGRRRKKEGQG